MKAYRGDGVYAKIHLRRLILTTENGGSITNTIVLEPDVYSSLVQFIKQENADDVPHQTGCVCADCSGAGLTTDND